LRVLTVSAFYESHGGGIEIVAGEMARALGRRRHQSRWAAAAFDAAPHDKLIEAVPLDAFDPIERSTGLPMPVPRKEARALLKREIEMADAVIVHDALYASSLLAAHFARRDRKPWLLVQHIGAIPYISPALKLAMAAANTFAAKPLLRAAPHVVFISDAVRQYFGGAAPASKSTLLFNGVDHALFSLSSDNQRRNLRTGLKCIDGRSQLLFVGRFVEKKGLSVLRSLAAQRPDCDLLMVGSGPIDPDAWNLPNVRRLGRKSREELADLYRAADALVLPSVGEGFPLVVQEAMASGLPVFCGQDSAAADPAARTLLHGIAVDPRDPHGTAARFSNAIFQSELGPNPRLAEHARATYDWDANAKWLEEYLEPLTAPFTSQHALAPDLRRVTRSAA
jgi:glycosyltransferase involved in cell wall biosynthesis